MKHLKGVVVAATALLIASTAACGSSGSSGSSGGGTIKYAAQLDMTGPAGFAGIGCKYGIQMALSEINAHGGINGKKLSLDVADSKTDPSGGALAVRKLVQQDKASFIHSCASSTSTVGGAPVAEQLKTPIVSSLASDPELLTAAPHAMFIASAATHDITGAFLAKLAFDKYHPKSIGIIRDTATVHTAIVRDAIIAAAKKAGIPVVSNLTFKQGDTNFATQINTFQHTKPSLIFTLGYTVVVGEFVKDARAAGMTQQFLGDYGQVGDDMINITGKAGQGYISVWMGGPYLTSQDPAMTGFIADFKKRFPHATKDYPDFATVQAYDDTFVIADALRRAGKDLSAASVTKALESTSNVVAGPGSSFPYAYKLGLPITWTATEHAGTHTMTALQIKGTQWVPIGSD